MNPITRSSSVREILEEAFADDIGFHQRVRQDKSALVYNKRGCGTLIDAALDSFGISDENDERN